MRQRSLKRVLIVALLAGGLASMGAGQVQAASVESSQGLWKWLARVWEEKVAGVWELPGTGRGHGIHEKAGVGIDPNGGATHSVTPAGGPVCHSWSEAGGCIDPNG